MALQVGTQQVVTDPNVCYPGDQYGLSKFWLPTQGFNAFGDVPIAFFVWGLDGTQQVTAVKGTNTQLAGIVIRNQATVIPYGDTRQGYSMLVADGYSCETLSQGNIAAVLASLNDGSVVNGGDAVYVNNLTGEPTVGVTVQPGYTQTNWIVKIASVPNTFDAVLSVISNVEGFLGV